MNKNFEKSLELFFLSVIIILQIADFLEILPGDLDFIKKIISFAVLGYLFVKVSLTSVLFNSKNEKFDLIIILTYFLLITKDMVSYMQVALNEAVYFKPFFLFVTQNAFLIEKYSFYLAGYLLIFISLYMALKFTIKKPSFLAVIQETGKPPRSILKAVIRFLAILIVLDAFFIVVFNLAVEWLAVALDAPLTVLAIVIYFFIIVRYHKRFKTTHFVYKIGHVGENFYRNFIRLFHYKNTVYMGVMGLLALHLLTDIGNFIVPYTLGLKDVLYFGHLGPDHLPIQNLLNQDITRFSTSFPLVLAYAFNTFALIFLLILPTFVWYRIYKKKALRIPRVPLALVFSSLLFFMLMPSFYLRKITVTGLVGVDILTKSIMSSPSVMDIFFQNKVTALYTAILLSILLGIVVFLLEYNRKAKKHLFIVAVFKGLVFFGVYMFYFFISFYQYFIDSIVILLKSEEWLIGYYFVLFATILIVFYIGGYIYFIYKVFHHHFLSKRI
jgi:hypothetical protein